jgi:aminoglycoside phosphotransferase (APT) family kinase protein
MHGDVAMPPFPDWVAGDAAIESVAVLQRRLHDASQSYLPPTDSGWDTPNLPPPPVGAIVCHNDLCVENVVFTDGHATAFIDFDFAAPADPLLDVAIACRHWVPFKDPADLTDGFAGVDQARRFSLYCDAYGVAPDERRTVIGHAVDFLDRALVTMRAKAEEGLPLYVAVWEKGYEKQNRRSHEWLRRFGETLAG